MGKRLKWAYVTISLLTLIFISHPTIVFASNPSTAKGGHTSSGASRCSTTWNFADGYTGWQNYFGIRNTSTSQASVTFYFYDENQLKGQTSISVPPNRRGTVYANSYVPGSSTNFCTHIVSTQPIVAERSMYTGYEGTCGNGSWGVSTSGWVFGDVYADASSIAYIQVNNRRCTTRTYKMWLAREGDVYAPSIYVNGYCRGTWNISGGGNHVAVIYSTSDPYFVAERSWSSGSKKTSSGGTPFGNTSQQLFAEGYSSYPTWFASGWSDLTFQSSVDLEEYHSYRWGTSSINNVYRMITNNDALSLQVSGVPDGTNYSTEVYRSGWYYHAPPSPPPSSYWFCTERTTFAPNGNWATSSEGRNIFDRVNNTSEFFFADCYTGHDVYLTLGNFSSYSTATFNIWVTTDTSNNYSTSITINRAGSLRLNDLVPGSQNCCIHVIEVSNRWPVSVEKSSYFN